MDAKKVTRIEHLQHQFADDYTKAIKKHKLISIKSKEFGRFAAKAGLTGFGNSKSEMRSEKEEVEEKYYFDPAFLLLWLSMNDQNPKMENPIEEMFNWFVERDPTTNKEYLHWYLNLYRDLIKQRKPFGQVSEKELSKELLQDGSFTEMLQGGAEARFFEDMFKVQDALERFDFLKKTNILKEEQKDINRYSSFEDFLVVVKPFMTAEEGSADVDTLDHNELKAIQNQFEYLKGNKNMQNQSRATLVHQDNTWVIVITENKEANYDFGKYTTWCTAGTRYSNMFENYAKNGPLFVLIKKGHGSKKSISANPNCRLQFHFESEQYMQAEDRGISIAQFLTENKEVKEFFKKHIVNSVLVKKYEGNIQNSIQFLTKLGYGGEIIKIYKDVQPEKIDLSKFKMEEGYLDEIGDIVSLKTLILNECGLKALPESMRRLKNLEHLSISANPEIKELPSWFNELTNLTDFYALGCDIRNQIDVTGLTRLNKLILDCNPKMTKQPKGLETTKHLNMLSLSNCDIRELTDTVLECKELFLLDLNSNVNLTKIPHDVMKLALLTGVCLDRTAISKENIQKLLEVGAACGADTTMLLYDDQN